MTKKRKNEKPPIPPIVDPALLAKARELDAQIRAVAARMDDGHASMRARLDQARMHQAAVAKFLAGLDQEWDVFESNEEVRAGFLLTCDVLECLERLVSHQGDMFDPPEWREVRDRVAKLVTRAVIVQRRRDELEAQYGAD